MRPRVLLGVILLACGGESSSGEDTESESTASSDAEDTSAVPAGWVPVQAECGFDFQAPPELTPIEVGSIDSCVDGWSTPSCMYRGDYGAYSSDLTEYLGEPEYEATRETIDGRSAKLVTVTSDGLFIAAVFFASVDPAIAGLRLTLWAGCEDVDERQDALRVFRTITFDEPAPNEPAY